MRRYVCNAKDFSYRLKPTTRPTWSRKENYKTFLQAQAPQIPVPKVLRSRRIHARASQTVGKTRKATGSQTKWTLVRVGSGGTSQWRSFPQREGEDITEVDEVK